MALIVVVGVRPLIPLYQREPTFVAAISRCVLYLSPCFMRHVTILVQGAAPSLFEGCIASLARHNKLLHRGVLEDAVCFYRDWTFRPIDRLFCLDLSTVIILRPVETVQEVFVHILDNLVFYICVAFVRLHQRHEHDVGYDTAALS